MAAIWRSEDSGWGVLEPTRYDDEAELHTLVEEAPHVLPLSGTPQVAILGREVGCGPGSADLVGVEVSGRPVVIEVKLARNPEARRAVVAQILSYASYLRGLSFEQFEALLRLHLARNGAKGIADVAEEADQSGNFDRGAFTTALEGHLAQGSFRLVLVLDAAPSDLVQLVGYLESISAGQVAVDLVTVSSYVVGDTRLLVPQRLDPGQVVTLPETSMAAKPTAVTVAGGEEFVAAISTASPSVQTELKRLSDWARKLEENSLARLYTSHGQGRKTLVVRINGHDAGLVTVWNDNGAYLSIYRTVFDKLAPDARVALESLGVSVGQGNTLRNPTDEILSILTRAYKEAVTKKLQMTSAPLGTGGELAS